MKRLLVVLAVGILGLISIPAQANMYPIGTKKVLCQHNRSHLTVENGKVLFTGRLAIGGVRDPQHFTYAQYVKIRLSGVTHTLPLEVVYYIKNTEKCVAAKLAAPALRYNNEKRARVKLYSSDDEWASTDIYRHLNRK